MKKAFAFLFVAGMITLAACGGKTEEATTSTTEATTATVDTMATDTAAVDTAAAK
ncbi:MAG: hypothetical protein ACK4GN_05555 [Runella sp.]